MIKVSGILKILLATFSKSFRGFNTLIIGIILARYLGPNDYGILSYSLAYIFLFIALAKMGLDSIVVET